MTWREDASLEEISWSWDFFSFWVNRRRSRSLEEVCNKLSSSSVGNSKPSRFKTELWLNCPYCDTPAIPPTRVRKGEPRYVADGKVHVCVKCNERMKVQIDRDGVAWTRWVITEARIFMTKAC